jgi:transcriptional regulator with XRE-family HTH domain
MSLFSDNIRHLRIKKDLSQEIVAESLSISRDSLAKYEQGRSQPPHEILIKLSHYYHVSIDLLLTADIRKINLESLLKMDDNRILLPIVVDKSGNNVIEVVPHKAKAGYFTGYSDPEFIESLQHISLPFLGTGKFRSFAVDGDSMPPHKDSSFIVGRYVENINEAKEGKSYIVMTTEGMTYKRLKKKNAKSLLLESDNEFYKPFEVKLSEVLELWEYAGSVATEEFEKEDISKEDIRGLLQGLRQEINQLKDKN